MAIALTSCTTGSGGDSSGPNTDPPPTAAGTAGCGPVEHPPLQVSSHVVGEAEPPGDFSSVPATSGWHTNRVPEPGRYDKPLRDAEIVSALENGIVVLAVEPDLLASSDDTVDGLLEQFPERLLVTPYPAEMPSPVALLTWGGLQRCEQVDEAATTAFVLTERVSADEH